MIGQNKLIYSTKEVFSDFLSEKGGTGWYFNIPEYQRGYKWTNQDITTLLDDLNHFSPTENDFYCLQNITITNKNYCFNVIDGQQRLTTLFLLLSYLKKLPNASCLRYSVRESTHKFLQNDVFSHKVWDSEINPGKATSKDQYYILQACKAIQEWFGNNSEVLTEMTDKLLNNLKLIVNEVEPNEEEIVFSSLNGGKVNLDGADLVRAILITRAARQKYPEEKESAANIEKVGSFRAKLGLELDTAAQWWGRSDVLKYFKQLLPDAAGKNKRFNLEKHPIDLLYFAFFEAYKANFDEITKADVLDVRHFENGIDFNGVSGDDHLEFYEKISEFNLTMQDWYNTDEIYNLVGYLMFNFKNPLNFASLWGMWTKVRTKSEFISALKKEIQKKLAFSFEPYDSKETTPEDLKKEIGIRLIGLFKKMRDTGAYWYGDQMLYPILTLADILPANYKGKEQRHRVEVVDFRRQGDEDKEHIRSQHRNLYYINKENMTAEQKELLEKENKEGLNSLGNMVLLHESINRGYGNAPLNEKMERILGEAAVKQIHIRPYTEQVFRSKLESLDSNSEISDELFWSKEDVARTANSLVDRIKKYLEIEL